MDITLLYFDDCPNWHEADQRLRDALRQTGHDPELVTYTEVDTAEQAERMSFRGSPTVLIDGVDPFADDAAPVGLSCRIYRTPDGPGGAPTMEQLASALRSRNPA